MSLNWIQPVSFYRQNQVWAAKQQASRQDNEQIYSALSDKMADAAANRVSGMSTVALHAALERLQATVTARQAQAAALSQDPPDLSPPSYASSSWDNSASSVTLSDGSTVRSNATQYLSGGTKINLDSGTLILSDGTVIDTKTGLKRVNLTA